MARPCDTANRTIGKDAIHLVNAWATRNGIALGQWKTDTKSNEITAIPPLLRQLNVAGCIVTLDAMGAQTEIAQTIRDEKADYVLRVKANQGHLHQDIQDWFAHADQVQFADMPHSYAETVNKGHGRIEIRRCWAISDPLAFEYIGNYDGWAGLQTIVRVRRERRLRDITTTEIAYYISSLPADAEPLLMATRFHWAVENSLHWVLDVTFREDDARIRVGYAAHNMAILRQMALNTIKKDSPRAVFVPNASRPGLISPSLKSYSCKFDAFALALYRHERLELLGARAHRLEKEIGPFSSERRRQNTVSAQRCEHDRPRALYIVLFSTRRDIYSFFSPLAKILCYDHM